MAAYVLYQHRKPITDEVFYVGIGNMKRPFQFHGRNDFWVKYTRKYGLPAVEICFRNLEKSKAIVYEKMLIDVYGRRGIDKCGLLVNRTKGGDGVVGLTVSDATRNKLSQINLGKKRPKEHCIKISEGQKGRKLWDDSGHKITYRTVSQGVCEVRRRIILVTTLNEYAQP